jgi:hypothetical protein
MPPSMKSGAELKSPEMLQQLESAGLRMRLAKVSARSRTCLELRGIPGLLILRDLRCPSGALGISGTHQVHASPGAHHTKPLTNFNR